MLVKEIVKHDVDVTQQKQLVRETWLQNPRMKLRKMALQPG